MHHTHPIERADAWLPFWRYSPMVHTEGRIQMKRWSYLLLAVCVTCLAPAAAFAADPPAAAIDKILATWDKPDTPGAALAVVRDGTIIYSRGYGMANLEYGVANAPSTIFHAASLSKQFTALCIHILAQEGKLSLDDPLRKHVPEMSVEGPPITIRHLLHHTSGLRDQWDLLTLAGLRLDDGITDGDILGLLWQQKQLNFQPGDEDLYSNSGYSLLGLIVRRVSGRSLAAFAQERIFGPLGMKNTHFHESYGALVKGRAYSYQRNRDGSYRYVALSFSNTGATSLFTTVEDLALWNGNFDEPRAGGPAAVAALLVSGRWNDGREIGYASGVGVQPYRGVPAVAHSGGDAGYRSYFLRLPQQKLAVIVLANASDFIAGDVASRVADLYLDGMPGVQPQKTWPREVELHDRDLAPYAGDYEVRPGSVLSLVIDKGKLYSQSGRGQRLALFASAGNEFFTKGPDITLTFPATVDAEPGRTALWRQGSREYPLRRIVRETPSTAALQACAGDYYSEELRALYTLEMRQGKLMVRYPRGVLELQPINPDVFQAGYPMGTITMKRDAKGTCEGFGVTTGRVRNLRFVRMKVAPLDGS
jgi:CubicO group peptidase (beta-lactamase class C family)